MDNDTLAQAQKNMSEVEIKLEIPASRKADVVAAVERAGSRTRTQRAVYFDTPAQALGQRSLVLRLRMEDGQWVQTAKAPGSSALERLEHEAQAPSLDADAGTVPPLDLSRHDGTAVGKLLRRALSWDGAGAPHDLAPRFEVAVQRIISEVRHGASTIELALDTGEVRAGEHTEPVCELELELKSGSVADLIALARQWRGEFGLDLSVIGKAQKGTRLAQGERFGAATTAAHPTLARRARSGMLSRAVLQSCADQVMANASELARGSSDPHHVHQVRVGIRRLRTALRELPLGSESPERAGIEQALVETFRKLGEHRDRQQVVEHLAPRIEAAGGAPVELGSGEGEDAPSPERIVKEGAFQDALLQLLALAHGIDAAAGGGARKLVRPTLDQLLRKILRDARRFPQLPLERQHSVRKRLKRLRYLSEFAASQFAQAEVERFIDRLKPVQEALGLYNDGLVARQVYEAAARDDPRAAWGAGWLTAQAHWQALACAKALRKLRKAEPFWR